MMAGKKQEDSRAGLLRKIAELEKKNDELMEESNRLFDVNRALIKSIEYLAGELHV